MTSNPGKSVLKIKAGDFQIFFEGSEDYISSRLGQAVQEIAKCAKDLPSKQGDGQSELISLPELLKKQQESTQVRRFLVVAAWLQKKGRNSLRTGDIDRTIKKYRLPALSNSSDNLSSLRNSKRKRFCEMNDDGSFYVTYDGMEEVGLA